MAGKLNDKKTYSIETPKKNWFGRWTQHGHFETIVDILMHENSIKMC